MVKQLNLTNTAKIYNITINPHVQSKKLLEFLIEYETTSKIIKFIVFQYTPVIILTPSLFQNVPLANISKNSVIMSLISEIFMQFPQYFSNAVSSIKDVEIYDPYVNITYKNSVFGIITFSC